MTLATRLRTRIKAADPEMHYALERLTESVGKPLMATVIKAAEGIADHHMMVYKAADGTRRWLSRSSTSFQDKDGQWVTKAALTNAAKRMQQTGNYGPLRWWHMGTKGEGPCLDIGDCDTSFVCGETLYESGTFRDPVFAELVKADDEISIGFIPLDNNDGIIYDDVDIIERSVCPAGTARNLFTGVSVA